MLKMLNPYALLAALVGALLLWGAGYATGYDHANDAAKLREAENLRAAVIQQRAEAERVLGDERALRRAAAARHQKYFQENEDAKAVTAGLISDLQRDVKRLRVPVRPGTCPVPSSGGGSAAAGSGAEGHAELTPDAGVFVVGLVDRGDAGIRKHAAVVDLYNELAARCGAPGTTQ